MASEDDKPRIPEKCPNCGKGPFIRDAETGELVCANCGYILSEKEETSGPVITSGQGKMQFASGPPESIASPDMGLSTVIGRADTDAGGRAIRGRAKTSLQRLRVLDRRSRPKISGLKNMKRAFEEIRTIAEKLSLGDDVIERAAYVYRKAVERKVTRGRSTVDIAAAALYAACREMQIPRNIKDIAAAGNIDRSGLMRSYRTLLSDLDLKVPVEEPIRSLARIGSVVEASPRTLKRAREILDRANALGLSAGKEPMSQAGATLYLASQIEGEKGKTQKEIAKAAEVTEVTLRNRYHSLKTGLKL